MTDDLASAYSSIYDKKEEGKEQIDELGPLAAVPLAMKAIKIGSAIKTGIDTVKNIMPKKQQERGGTANNLQTAGHQPEGEMIEDVAITHLDGSTTEVIDVVKPEPLADKEDQEALHDRLWDQVTANLTTLGEMAGVRYQVSPVEELEEKKKSKMADKDYDGDGKVESGTDEYMGSKDKAIKKAMAMKKEGFNVKSPVIFSKPEEKVEETISEEIIEKHASSISKAHKAIKK
tara:strand:+ start:157 stop:852 length:696 start_codon:yes stop_codon:yes gene_type:complete